MVQDDRARFLGPLRDQKRLHGHGAAETDGLVFTDVGKYFFGGGFDVGDVHGIETVLLQGLDGRFTESLIAPYVYCGCRIHACLRG